MRFQKWVKKEFKDNNEKCRNRISHKIDFIAAGLLNGHADNVKVNYIIIWIIPRFYFEFFLIIRYLKISSISERCFWKIFLELILQIRYLSSLNKMKCEVTSRWTTKIERHLKQNWFFLRNFEFFLLRPIIRKL